MSKGKYELLGQSLIMFSAFVPFFGCKELERVLGKGQLLKLFFRGREAGSDPFR